MKREVIQFPLAAENVALSTKTALGQHHSGLHIQKCYKIVYSKNTSNNNRQNH